MNQEGTLIEVADDDQLVQRVAAIDVAKASGMICTRVPHGTIPGKRVTRVWQVSATTNDLLALADQLAAEGIERIVLESTSDYWRPFFYLLEARELQVWLVNARDVKNVPGRPKTDVLTELTRPTRGNRGRCRLASARFCSHGQRRERSAGSVRAGGAALWCAEGHRPSLRTVSAG